VRALNRPPPPGLDRGRDTLDRDLALKSEDLQQVTGLARVVTAVQMHGREQVLTVHAAVLGQRADHLHDADQGRFQQRRIVIVGPGRNQVQRDALVIAGQRTVSCPAYPGRPGCAQPPHPRTATW